MDADGRTRTDEDGGCVRVLSVQSTNGARSFALDNLLPPC